MPRSRRAGLLAASGVAVIALLTAGCDDDSYAGGAPGQNSGQAAGGAPALLAADSASLGKIVTDGEGHTLYRFDEDSAKPPSSNCSGNCADNWHPVTAESTVEVTGIDSRLIGSVTRADGTRQVTLGGWPLYRFIEDTKPGDTKGQGAGGAWFVSNPEGRKAAAGSGPGSGSIASTSNNSSNGSGSDSGSDPGDGSGYNQGSSGY